MKEKSLISIETKLPEPILIRFIETDLIVRPDTEIIVDEPTEVHYYPDNLIIKYNMEYKGLVEIENEEMAMVSKEKILNIINDYAFLDRTTTSFYRGDAVINDSGKEIRIYYVTIKDIEDSYTIPCMSKESSIEFFEQLCLWKMERLRKIG
jgi:hypothetical protein